ncbi:MAG: hypothetical protein ABI822_20950 [Bryobacteraceae bacterium]
MVCLPCLCQTLSIGAKGGVRASGELEGSGTSESKRYLIGPALEVKLPFRFAVEVDALYSRFGLRSSDAIFGNIFNQSWRADSWEFPVLAKFEPVRPIFFEGGYVPRSLRGSTHFDSILADLSGNRTRQIFDQKTDYDVSHGIVMGGGVDLPLGPLRLSPEVRYTRWLNRAFDNSGSRGFFLQSSQNRVEILVTIWSK